MGTVIAFNGTKVLLSGKRWKHIVLRHPELEDKKSIVLGAVASPMKCTLTLPEHFMP